MEPLHQEIGLIDFSGNHAFFKEESQYEGMISRVPNKKAVGRTDLPTASQRFPLARTL
jgi:hypothetical protein